MKIFIATFGAIMAAAFVIGGYIKYSAEQSQWEREKIIDQVVFEEMTKRVSSANALSESDYGTQVVMATRRDAIAKYVEAEKLFVKILEQKPFFPLTADERKTLDDMKADLQARQAATQAQ